jgi:hypothetical protein
MKFIPIVLVALFYVNAASAQSVKFKKDLAYVDNIPYLNWNRDYGNDLLSNLNGEDLIKLEYFSFDVPNPARANTMDPNRFNFPATIKESYYVVTFLDHDITFETGISLKMLIAALYKENIIDSSGRVNVVHAEKLAKKMHTNISGSRPNVILIRD